MSRNREGPLLEPDGSVRRRRRVGAWAIFYLASEPRRPGYSRTGVVVLVLARWQRALRRARCQRATPQTITRTGSPSRRLNEGVADRMLTPAEELGLSGASLASRVRKAFYTIPKPALAELIEQIRGESFRRHLIYLRDGELDTIRVLPCPITVLPDQLSYIHFVSLTIHNALKRLPELYLQDFAVRDVLRISPGEEEWLWKCWDLGQREQNPVFGRLDAMIDFTSPMWKDSLRFVEPNLSGIGGLHLVPTAERIVADLVLPVLQEHDPQLQLTVGKDIRELLMQEVARSPRSDRPAGPEHLFRRAEVRRQRPRRAGSAGPVLSRPPRHEDHARRPARVESARGRGLLRRRGDRPGLSRLRCQRSARLASRRRGHRADADPVPAEPRHLLDHRRAGSEELLGSA